MAEQPAFRFDVTSTDPIVRFAALVEMGIAEMEARKAAEARQTEAALRLEAVFGQAVSMEEDFSFELQVQDSPVGAGNEQPRRDTWATSRL